MMTNNLFVYANEK